MGNTLISNRLLRKILITVYSGTENPFDSLQIGNSLSQVNNNCHCLSIRLGNDDLGCSAVCVNIGLMLDIGVMLDIGLMLDPMIGYRIHA